MKNVFDRILKIISSAIFVVLVLLIILILLYIVRVNFLASNNRLGEVRLNFYTILTQSMYPAIKAGDVVVTYKDDDNFYNSGDVITFISRANGGITVTHRVTEVFVGDGVYSYRTKGDNNNAEDTELINSSDVLGKVVVKVPYVGYIQQFMVSKTGWIVAVLLPCMGIVIYDILKLFKLTANKSKTVIKRTKESDEARKKLKEVMDDEKE